MKNFNNDQIHSPSSINIPPHIEEKIYSLESDDGIVREKARKELVAMGIPVVEYLMQLIEHPKQKVRWETVKALSEIADPASGPLFLLALKDTDKDIRWLATEGLISIGINGVRIVLNELITNSETHNLRQSAHHVFKNYVGEHPSKELYEVIEALESSDAEVHTPPAAEKAYRHLKHH